MGQAHNGLFRFNKQHNSDKLRTKIYCEPVHALLVYQYDGNRALRDMGECVVKEVGKIFPYESDESDDENDSTGSIDLLE